MNSSLRRCDYAQVGTTSTRCLCVIRADDTSEEGVSARSKASSKKTKSQRDRVVVGAQNGILLCMERKQGGDTNINCVQLGGALQTAQDKTFIAIGSQVRGFNRKGKQFLNFDSNMTEPISSLFIYGIDMFACGKTSVYHFHDCIETNFYSCPDTLNDVLCLPVVEGGWVGRGLTPVVACVDKTIKVLEAGRLVYEVKLTEVPTVLHLWMDSGGVNKQKILFGTANGRLGLIDLEQSHGRICFEMETRTYSSIVGIECHSILDSPLPEVIVGKEDGMVEVYSVDEATETLVYAQHYQCEEGITGLACGRISSREQSEIVVCTYTGWVFGLLGGAASWTQGGKVPGAKDSEAPQMEVKVQQLKSELDDLENRVRDERDRFQALAQSGNKEEHQVVLQATSVFNVHDKFELRKELSCYTLLLELSVQIDYILLQSDIKLDLLDVERNSAVISVTEAEAESGNGHLAVYRCQADVMRMDVRIRIVEGQFGTLRVYLVPRLLPITCQMRSYAIKPLALHERIHSWDDRRPMNVLNFTGAFSAAEAHSWLVLCIPQLPDRCPPAADEDNGVVFNFCSTVSETILQASYRKGAASFKSDNLSTVVILREVISRIVTMRQLKVHISCDVSNESVEHMLRLLHPQMEHITGMQRQLQLARGAKELESTFGDRSFLTAELKDALSQYEKIHHDVREKAGHFDRLMGIIVDLYIDKYKMLGRSVKSRIGELLSLLSGDYSLKRLQGFFDTS